MRGSSRGREGSEEFCELPCEAEFARERRGDDHVRKLVKAAKLSSASSSSTRFLKFGEHFFGGLIF